MTSCLPYRFSSYGRSTVRNKCDTARPSASSKGVPVFGKEDHMAPAYWSTAGDSKSRLLKPTANGTRQEEAPFGSEEADELIA